MVVNRYLAEFLGTFILVYIGSMGIVAVGGAGGAAQIVAIAFAFGLALLAGLWAVGHVSGGHFNPAVTLAMLVDGRTSFSDAIGYWVGQFAGAVVASLVVLAATSQDEVAMTVTGFQATSTGIISELVLTTIFVSVILAVTKTGANHAPAVIALTLVAAHLGGIPFSGSSVNPARSFGPALVSGEVGQLWVYVVFPFVGGLAAWALYRLFPAEERAPS